MRVRSGRTPTAVAARFPATRLTTLVADLTGPLDLPPLDGLVAANSLHYVGARPAGRRDPVAGRPSPPRRAVHRRRVRRRPRQPLGAAPVLEPGLGRLASAAGLEGATEIGRVPSRFLGAIYAAVSRRPSAVDQPLDVARVVVALRRDADEDRRRRIGRARAGARHRKGHDRDLDPVLIEELLVEPGGFTVGAQGRGSARPPSSPSGRRGPVADRRARPRAGRVPRARALGSRP